MLKFFLHRNIEPCLLAFGTNMHASGSESRSRSFADPCGSGSETLLLIIKSEEPIRSNKEPQTSPEKIHLGALKSSEIS